MADNKKTNKDKYREGFAQRNPDIDINDEEAVYGRMNEGADELARYKEMNDNFNRSVSQSPLFTDMLMASQNNPNFDPFVFMMEHGGVENFEDAIQDPEYLSKLAEANKKSLERQAKDKEIKDRFEKNIGPSLEGIHAKAKEMGHTPEQEQQVFQAYYDAAFNATDGIYSPDVYELFAKGLNFDKAVEDARNEGVADGLNRKVNDTLRSLPESREGNGGRQSATVENTSVGEEDDMFGLGRKRRKRTSFED